MGISHGSLPLLVIGDRLAVSAQGEQGCEAREVSSSLKLIDCWGGVVRSGYWRELDVAKARKGKT